MNLTQIKDYFSVQTCTSTALTGTHIKYDIMFTVNSKFLIYKYSVLDIPKLSCLEDVLSFLD